MKEPIQHPYDIREEIRAAIDAYEWKHSWHLPSDQFGHTQWSSVETWRECLEVLESYRSGAIAFAAKCDRLAGILKHHIARHEADELAESPHD